MRRMKTQAAVKDLSEQLAKAVESSTNLEEAETKKGAVARARSVVFESANAPKEFAASAGLKALSTLVFIKDEDIEKKYRWIVSTLSLGEKLGEHGYRIKALDFVETAYREAHQLFITTKLMREIWEKENEVNFAQTRTEATKALQQEKDAGYRSKQITDADVNAKCAEMFPDEWRGQERRRSEYKLTEESMLNLVDVCASRCRTMQSLVSKG